MPELRFIPSVDKVLKDLGPIDLPRPLVLRIVRRELRALREQLRCDTAAAVHRSAKLISCIRQALDTLRSQRIQPVINGTGIIVHTNLGRSPLAPAALAAMTEVAAGYSNLEYDLTEANRGGRSAYLNVVVATLCGAESAMIVNNCAGALLLILHHFATKSPKTNVIISRGELVQIGGGFRIPEILQASGATLLEVGTTNQTTADDYRAAIDADAAMILKVHQSNFYMDGFVAEANVRELVQIARSASIPLVVDIGSGAVFDTASLGGGESEPTPAKTLEHGTDLITFSGDKLLGGPQAGIIAGRADLISALLKDPFFRAFRCDKLILTALQASVELLLADRTDEIPIRAMMHLPLVRLRHRAEKIAGILTAAGLMVAVGTGESQVGGGSLPRTQIPSVTIELFGRTPQKWSEALRCRTPPIIGCVSGGVFKIDLRTVLDSQDELLIDAIMTIAKSP